MTELDKGAKKSRSILTVALIFVVTLFVLIGTLLSPLYDQIVPNVEGTIDMILTLATNVIYLIGGGIIVFGALAAAVRFIQAKLKDTYQPSYARKFLSGYLTLSLEFFIGAEIIKTVVTRTFEEFTVLILVIISRGLFSLILYLERKWHGEAETE